MKGFPYRELTQYDMDLVADILIWAAIIIAILWWFCDKYTR